MAREAEAVGLGEDDTIIRRRLAQKLKFLVEDTVQLAEPSETELRAFLRRQPQAAPDSKIAVRIVACRPFFPSPLVGEGASERSEGRGEGWEICSHRHADPSPGSRSLSLRTRHPLPQGGEGKKFAARNPRAPSLIELSSNSQRSALIRHPEGVRRAASACEPRRMAAGAVALRGSRFARAPQGDGIRIRARVFRFNCRTANAPPPVFFAKGAGYAFISCPSDNEGSARQSAQSLVSARILRCVAPLGAPSRRSVRHRAALFVEAFLPRPSASSWQGP